MFDEMSIIIVNNTQELTVSLDVHKSQLVTWSIWEKKKKRKTKKYYPLMTTENNHLDKSRK